MLSCFLSLHEDSTLPFHLMMTQRHSMEYLSIRVSSGKWCTNNFLFLNYNRIEYFFLKLFLTSLSFYFPLQVQKKAFLFSFSVLWELHLHHVCFLTSEIFISCFLTLVMLLSKQKLHETKLNSQATLDSRQLQSEWEGQNGVSWVWNKGQ